jgi:hypothetical protein
MQATPTTGGANKVPRYSAATNQWRRAPQAFLWVKYPLRDRPDETRERSQASLGRPWLEENMMIQGEYNERARIDR